MAKRRSRLHQDLRTIGKAVKALARHFERIAPQLGEHRDVLFSDSPRGKRPRKRPDLSPAQRRALKNQGKYMGTMRGLSAASKMSG